MEVPREGGQHLACVVQIFRLPENPAFPHDDGIRGQDPETRLSLGDRARLFCGNTRHIGLWGFLSMTGFLRMAGDDPKPEGGLS